MQRMRCQEQLGWITDMGSTGCQGVRDSKGAETKSSNQSKLNTPCIWHTNDKNRQEFPNVITYNQINYTNLQHLYYIILQY